MNLVMICLREDGTEIERRSASRCKRFSMQAASDHKAADKAKAELGEALHCVSFPHVNLYFKDGKSFSKY